MINGNQNFLFNQIKKPSLVRDDIPRYHPYYLIKKLRVAPKGRKSPRYHPNNLESDQLTAL